MNTEIEQEPTINLELLNAWVAEADKRKSFRPDNPVRLVRPGTFPAPPGGYRMGQRP